VNYAVGSFLTDRFERKDFADAQILHYHDALTRSYFDHFVEQLKTLGGGQAEWLAGFGPVDDPQNYLSKLIGLPSKMKRKLQRRLHVMQSRTLQLECSGVDPI
jgi:hypothetical protein